MGIVDYFRRGRQGRKDGIAANRRRALSPPDHGNHIPLSRVAAPIIACLLVIGTCAVLTVYRSPFSRTDTVSLLEVPGQRVPANIHAQVAFNYVDRAATEEAQEFSEAQVLNVYRLDRVTSELVLQYFTEFFQLISKPRHTDDGPREYSEPVTKLHDSLSPERLMTVQALFSSGDKQAFFMRRLEAMLDTGIIPTDTAARHGQRDQRIVIVENQRRSRANFSELQTPSVVAHALTAEVAEKFLFADTRQITSLADDVVVSLIRPNLTYDFTETKKARHAARAQVKPIKRWVEKGTVFLEKGRLLTTSDLEKLQAYREAMAASEDSSLYYQQIVVLFVMSILVLTAAIVFLHAVLHDTFSTSGAMLLIAFTVAFNLVVCRAVEAMLLFALSGARMYVTPALPLGFGAVFLTLLIGERKGMVVGVFLALLHGLHASESMHVVTLGVFASCAGALSVRTARTRTQTFRAIFAIGAITFLLEAIALSLQSTPWRVYPIVLGLAFANGIAVVMLVNLLQPLAEYIFGMTTNIGLLELTDLNHPLLKRLQLEAPGTYHHTLMVATLSEHAADTIGANPLLARVCSYFHDIGKLSNPSYFTENSLGADRHKDLSPRMSALIIVNHVKEGLAMATKYKLKKPLRDVIASHHGTSLIVFFYHRAMSECEDGVEINKDDFCYPGPLPRSREASIISLADACEAASRSLEKPTPQKISALVSEIFRNRLLEGQLAESELTMTEISQVEESIKTTLRTMLHGRIAYPKLDPDGDDADLFIKPSKNSEHASKADDRRDAS